MRHHTGIILQVRDEHTLRRIWKERNPPVAGARLVPLGDQTCLIAEL